MECISPYCIDEASVHVSRALREKGTKIEHELNLHLRKILIGPLLCKVLTVSIKVADVNQINLGDSLNISLVHGTLCKFHQDCQV